MARVVLPPVSSVREPGDYAAFRGAISRWAWRVWAQRLTPGGRWFLLATAVFGAYGGASLQLQGYVLAAYASAVWAVAVAGALVYRPRVEMTARFSGRVCAGEMLPVDLEVRQVGRGRGADLVVVPDRLPVGVDVVPGEGVAVGDLAKGEAARVRMRLKCDKRGAYTLHGFRVETGFPFGLLRARRTFSQESQLLVYPRFSPLGRLVLPTGRRYQPGGVALASQIGESFEYLGNREYREGDNVRDIDWRATARNGGNRPVVREWVEEYMLRVAVVLDTHVPKGEGGRFGWANLLGVRAEARETVERREAFERAVSVAAGVSDYMARQDYLVDLFAAGPDLYHLTAGRSLAYLDQILDILALVGESGEEPFGKIEPGLGEMLERISTVICVLLDWDEARRAFVHGMRQQGVAVKVIVCREGRCTIDPAVDADTLGVVPVIGKDEFEKGIDEL